MFSKVQPSLFRYALHSRTFDLSPPDPLEGMGYLHPKHETLGTYDDPDAFFQAIQKHKREPEAYAIRRF
ncbi:hypothetical protein [Sphaerochaeta globosa]|uniref:hypothetical protein n=1 Tax=Sphaerochaeta globosa TaxID=1131703 RepID=UPI00059CED3E|nr:hypothetical protein [Sphaerochaeta globosa]